MYNYLFLQANNIMGDLVSNFVSAVPKVLTAILIAIVGIIISKVVSKIFRTFLEKIQIDKLGDKLNEIEFIDNANIKIKFSSFLSKILYYLMLIFFLVMATDVLAMPAISNLVAGLFNLIPSLIVALIILVVGTLFSEAIRKLVQTALESFGIPSAKMISTFLFYFLFINIALTALKQAKIDTAFLQQNISLLIGGIVLAFAIGYGFASKSTMSNFLASFYSQGKLNVGNTVSIDGTTGDIVSIDKSTMILKTKEGNNVIFPLHMITNSKIEIHN